MTAVEDVTGRRGPFLRVAVESPARVEGCRVCGVVMRSHGRRDVRLIDTPCFGRPVQRWWRKRTWHCAEISCSGGVITEQDDDVAWSRALLSTRACWWAIRQLRREHASVLGLARQLGTTWRTLWRAIEPLLQKMAADDSRFDGVNALGVDEHVWHHVSTKPIADGGRGPKELTGMVDPSVTAREEPVLGSWTRSREGPARPSPVAQGVQRTPSTTSSRTPSPCSMRSMS